jgi:IS66 Orf2 like protein
MISALSGVPPAGVRVLIATRPVDFRRGADSLAATVQSVLGQDPFCSTVLVFRSKRADRLKMLVYDGTGLVLIWKRLEGAKFKHRPDDLSAASPVNHHRRLSPKTFVDRDPKPLRSASGPGYRQAQSLSSCDSYQLADSIMGECSKPVPVCVIICIAANR